MIFNNKHYIKWHKKIKALINKNIRVMRNNSISKITIVNNRFSKLILFIFYKTYALIKHILIFNHSKAQLKIVKYFTVFITLGLWIFVIFVIYINNITSISSFISYIKDIWDPLIEGLNQKDPLNDSLTNFLDKFRSFNEHLDDNFIESIEDLEPKINYNTEKHFSNINNNPLNKTKVIEPSSDMWSNALIGIGLVIVLAGVYYGIIYLGNSYFGSGPDISPDATPIVRGTNLPPVDQAALTERWYNQLRTAGISVSTLERFADANIPLNEVLELYNKGMPCDLIINYYTVEKFSYQDILAAINNSDNALLANNTNLLPNFTTTDSTLGGSASGSQPWSSIGYDVTPNTTSGLLREQQNTLNTSVPLLDTNLPTIPESPISSNPTDSGISTDIRDSGSISPTSTESTIKASSPIITNTELNPTFSSEE